ALGNALSQFIYDANLIMIILLYEQNLNFAFDFAILNDSEIFIRMALSLSSIIPRKFFSDKLNFAIQTGCKKFIQIMLTENMANIQTFAVSDMKDCFNKGWHDVLQMCMQFTHINYTSWLDVKPCSNLMDFFHF